MRLSPSKFRCIRLQASTGSPSRSAHYGRLVGQLRSARAVLDIRTASRRSCIYEDGSRVMWARYAACSATPGSGSWKPNTGICSDNARHARGQATLSAWATLCGDTVCAIRAAVPFLHARASWTTTPMNYQDGWACGGGARIYRLMASTGQSSWKNAPPLHAPNDTT